MCILPIYDIPTIQWDIFIEVFLQSMNEVSLIILRYLIFRIFFYLKWWNTSQSLREKWVPEKLNMSMSF